MWVQELVYKGLMIGDSVIGQCGNMKITQFMVVIVIGILSRCTDAANTPMQKVILEEAPSKVKHIEL